jgi:hypothetical protein
MFSLHLTGETASANQKGKDNCLLKMRKFRRTNSIKR